MWLCFSRQAADSKASIDGRIVKHINDLVNSGVYNTQEMRRHVRLYVRDLFAPRPLPPSTNRKYWPSRSDVQGLIYLEKKRLLNGLLDQEVLGNLIDRWRSERPDDSWFYRPPADVQLSQCQCGMGECNCVNGIASQNFILVYQAAWQKHLLAKYGQELVFMDATYRTTKYAIPVFFVCVHTNCGYFVAGIFVLEHEDSKSLAEALTVFSNMNNNWTPKAFMIDSSDLEMKAISSAFKGTPLYFFRDLMSATLQYLLLKIVNYFALHDPC